MNFNSYQKKILTFLSEKCTVTKHAQLTNSVLGLTGEAGECADILKKTDFHSHEFDREKFKRELGDVLFYVAEAADAIDCTLEEVAHTNVAKLTARYPNGFTVQDSLEKKDENTKDFSGTTITTKQVPFTLTAIE